MAPSQSACSSTDLAGKMGRGIQAIREIFYSAMECGEEEVRQREEKEAEDEALGLQKESRRVAGQGRS